MPEDVIACNPEHQKLRTCKYQIVSFVDSSTEITQLLVNLTKEEQEIANGDFEDDDFIENPFEEGDIIRAVSTLDEITEDKLIPLAKLKDDVDSVVNWWKPKAISRYIKLHEENRLKPDILFYNKIIGLTWEEAKETCLGDVGR
jgi:hypothetical protein